MNNAKKIRVGIAGMDHFYIGLAAVRELQQDANAELVIIAHRDRDRAKQTAEQAGAKWTTNYEEVANAEIDLLITACPTNQNAELVIEAAKQDKHIVSVKPFAMNLAEADQVVAAVEEAGVRFISFEASARLRSLYRQVKGWLREGKLGQPLSVMALQRAPMPEVAWPGTPFVRARTWWLDPQKSPGGGWIDHAIYTIDGLRWLFETEVERISGEIANLKHVDEPLEDFGVSTLVFKNKVVATLEVTWTVEPSGSTTGFQLVGTGGQLMVETVQKGTMLAMQPESQLKRIDYSDPILGWQAVDLPQEQGGLVSHMLQVLRGEVKPIADQNDARATLAACLAFYEAAKGSKVVTL
jgi:predicted dehydrogenase